MGFCIKERTYEHGLKLGELAQRLKMPLSNLSAIASGQRSVSLGLLSRIAAELDCEVPELFEAKTKMGVFRSAEINNRILQVERESYLGQDKSWTHRLNVIMERHFKSVREPGTSYGAPKGEYEDPHSALIDRFNKSGVDYVVVGMSAINYYASSAMETFGTRDYDLFLRPAAANIAEALKIFHELGYETATTEGLVSEKSLKQIVRQKKTVLAVNPDGVTFELLFAVSGFGFQRMAGDASMFRAGEVVIRVGKLHKLLASKKAAGRPKDRLFLKRYEMILKKKKQSD